ncbi:unnamed protein product [Amoebophrya sp. A120]|nr:unnamed protein product [Amoebophrya sp. A120]|eukprot:GSA120T00000687001.1
MFFKMTKIYYMNLGYFAKMTASFIIIASSLLLVNGVKTPNHPPNLPDEQTTAGATRVQHHGRNKPAGAGRVKTTSLGAASSFLTKNGKKKNARRERKNAARKMSFLSETTKSATVPLAGVFPSLSQPPTHGTHPVTSGTNALNDLIHNINLQGELEEKSEPPPVLSPPSQEFAAQWPSIRFHPNYWDSKRNGCVRFLRSFQMSCCENGVRQDSRCNDQQMSEGEQKVEANNCASEAADHVVHGLPFLSCPQRAADDDGRAEAETETDSAVGACMSRVTPYRVECCDMVTNEDTCSAQQKAQLVPSPACDQTVASFGGFLCGRPDVVENHGGSEGTPPVSSEEPQVGTSGPVELGAGAGAGAGASTGHAGGAGGASADLAADAEGAVEDAKAAAPPPQAEVEVDGAKAAAAEAAKNAAEAAKEQAEDEQAAKNAQDEEASDPDYAGAGGQLGTTEPFAAPMVTSAEAAVAAEGKAKAAEDEGDEPTCLFCGVPMPC